MHHTARSRYGFSLLELSVVLVIIGLLAGGAISARSFTKNSQLASMMTEAKYYSNAFGQFQAQWKAIPGDFAGATDTWPSASTSNGDGNGQLASESADPTLSESLLAFQHLAIGKFIEGSFSGTALAGVVSAGVNIPKSALKGATYLFEHPSAEDGSVASDAFYFDGFYRHLLRIAGKSTATTGSPKENILTTEQALSIDKKFDDGLPATGLIMTPRKSALAGSESRCVTTDLATTARYDTANEGEACFLLMKVD